MRKPLRLKNNAELWPVFLFFSIFYWLRRLPESAFHRLPGPGAMDLRASFVRLLLILILKRVATTKNKLYLLGEYIFMLNLVLFIDSCRWLKLMGFSHKGDIAL